MILDRIDSPEDLANVSDGELMTLAGEIRNKIIETVSENGGHLASNLGMVDAEIALLRVFDLSRDSILYDVGHQAYAHKLLTGRRDLFPTLRQTGGLSGFTNRCESEYDTITAGHSGTALSAAVGIAEANYLAGNDRVTVAVVGDGSFTNGMVYEALNQLNDRPLRLILLINDNAMSISKNVGGVSNYFSKIRTSRRYFSFKTHLKKFFNGIPMIGKSLVRAATAVKDFVKRTVGAETWFESIGLDYIGPADGNNILKMCDVLEEAKRKQKPVVVHMITNKGLGYIPAEEHPELYHSTSGFDIQSGENKKSGVKTFTDAFSDMICAEAAGNGNIVAVTAAMTDGCGLAKFRDAYPDRLFDVGIAEEHAVTFSAGLSIGSRGRIVPVLVLYSTFVQRVFDQIWHDFCLQNSGRNDLSLVLMLSHCGAVQGDGVTHQGIYDISLLSSLDGTEVYSPDTFSEMEKAFAKGVASKGLTVIRYPKAGENVYSETFRSHGNWKVHDFGGNDEVVVTFGRISGNVMTAADRISQKAGRKIAVIVLERIIPLPDDSDFVSLIENADRITVVEECVKSGGVGQMMASSFAGKRIDIIAIENPEIRCGDTSSILRQLGLDENSLEERL